MPECIGTSYFVLFSASPKSSQRKKETIKFNVSFSIHVCENIECYWNPNSMRIREADRQSLATELLKTPRVRLYSADIYGQGGKQQPTQTVCAQVLQRQQMCMGPVWARSSKCWEVTVTSFTGA